MYYPCSETKDADQLRSYCEADLRLCFRIGKNPVLARCGSFVVTEHFPKEATYESKDIGYPVANDMIHVYGSVNWCAVILQVKLNLRPSRKNNNKICSSLTGFIVSTRYFK